MNYFLNNISQMTHANRHTEALISVANVIGATKQGRILDAIKTISDLEGHNPLAEYRYQVYLELMQLAKERLPKEDYEALYAML